jgi:malate synthase
VTDVRVTGEPVERGEEVLTGEALAFVAELQRRFGPRRSELLARRAERREEVARTGALDFLPETERVALADEFVDFLTLPAYEVVD